MEHQCTSPKNKKENQQVGLSFTSNLCLTHAKGM